VRGEWGETTDYHAYLDTVNEELLLIPMIETQQAIDNINEILSVGRIDVLLVGPSDLSIELGVPLQYASDTYQAGLDKIAAACKHHGVVPGMYFIPPDMDPNWHRQQQRASADHALCPRYSRSDPRAVHRLSTVSPLGLGASLRLR
jgi:2-keto-3-deoxy-L-rhamnonate aldolase RhmA